MHCRRPVPDLASGPERHSTFLRLAWRDHPPYTLALTTAALHPLEAVPPWSSFYPELARGGVGRALSGELVKLSPKEYALLTTLAESAGQVVTHKRLLAAGWGDGATDTQYVRVYMGLLRQKLEGDPAEPRLILTEAGVGYRLADQ